MYKNLEKRNIFVIPAGEYFEHESEACCVIYAPLADKYFIATPEFAAQLEMEAKQLITSASGLSSKLEELGLLEGDERLSPEQCEDESKVTHLYLLLNEKCNFHCSYCYSAAGRSSAVMEMPRIEYMVHRVVNNAINSGQDFISITFMGGGEPFLSWELLEQTVDYAKKVCGPKKLKIGFSVSTNGSLLTDERLQFLKENHFSLQVSFEVLEDVQNQQRGEFVRVNNNIKKALTYLPKHVVIRSTITWLNVERIAEMVETCMREYPDIRILVLEPVIDTETFKDAESLNKFLSVFFENYLKAKSLSKAMNIRIGNSCYDSVDSLKKRYCSSMYCLTPYGSVMDCPNVSSPNQPGYDDEVYGTFDNGELRIDSSAWQRIMTNYLQTDSQCASCWAKWNCGGGCRSQRLVYSEPLFRELCVFRKNLLLHSIIERMTASFYKSTGQDMKSVVMSQLK